MPRPNNSDIKLRFINRHVDNSWRVWVNRHDIDCGQEYFYDSIYGSKGKSLKAAIKKRDELIKLHNIKLRVYDGSGYCLIHSKNTSGMVGVSLSKMEKASGSISIFWSARVQIDGKQKNKCWSIKKYGYVAAWRHAVAFRCSFTDEPIIKNPPLPPEWLLKIIKI